MRILCRIFGHAWTPMNQTVLIYADWDNPDAERREMRYEWQECLRCHTHHPDGVKVEELT